MVKKSYNKKAEGDMSDAKRYPIMWDEMHKNSKALAWKLSEKGDWKGIVAVTRGGMAPACIVARELDIKLIETLCISSYDHDEQRAAEIIKKPDIGDGEGWLIIDDLVDSGNTFKIARKLFPKAYYACVYAKPKGKETADTFVMDFSQDTWIDFPWDLEAKYISPIAEQKKSKKNGTEPS